jgi:hypothetical protein
MANKQKALMWVMFIVIVALAIVLLLTLVISPKISGFVVDKQTEGYSVGYQRCIGDVVNTALQNQVVQLPTSDGQILVLQPVQLIPQQQTAPVQ